MKNRGHMLVRPQRLVKGDTIGIVAPASSFDKNNFLEGIKTFRRLGYKVKYEKTIFNACWSQPGHNKHRARQINRMFADSKVKAIFCAKAGYGSAEIISHLDPEVIRNNVKIFIGYSDVTILLLYLQYVANMVVFHGPVVSGEFFRGMHPDTLDSFTRLLGEAKAYGPIGYTKIKALNEGKVSGEVIGGNLSLMLESIDSDYEIDTDDKILFVEEVDESVEVVRSSINALKEKGKLRNVRGIIFGRMTKCFGKEGDCEDFLKEMFTDAAYPILYNFPSGHTSDIAQAHFTLPLGVKVTLDAGRASVSIEEGAVR